MGVRFRRNHWMGSSGVNLLQRTFMLHKGQGMFWSVRWLAAFWKEFASSYLPHLTCWDLRIASYAWLDSLNGRSAHRRAYDTQTNGQSCMPRAGFELEMCRRLNIACAFNCSETVDLEWLYVSTPRSEEFRVLCYEMETKKKLFIFHILQQ